MMDISIIIVNYKTKGLVKQLLRRLVDMDLPCTYEIVLVDNASNDGTVSMVTKEFPTVRTIQNNENKGFGEGNNVGFAATDSTYVLILNPDVAVESSAIATLYAFMEEHKQIGLAAPRLLNPDGSVQFSCFRFPTTFMPVFSRTPLKKLPFIKVKYDKYRMLDFNHNDVRPVHWVVGGCMLIRRSALERAGYFDKRYFMYYEDIDLCRTLWQQGSGVYYVPGAELIHYHQRLSADASPLKSFLNKTLYYHLFSWIKYELKYLNSKNPEVKNLID